VIVGLTVRHRAEGAAETLGETARKAELLEALFRELGIDEQDWVTGAVALNEWAEWDESSRREVRRGTPRPAASMSGSATPLASEPSWPKLQRAPKHP
jgi:hypothetical protein